MKNTATLFLLTLSLTACGDRRPSDQFLVGTLADKMRIDGISNAQVLATENAKLQDVDCVPSENDLVCKFNIAESAHVITLVKTGSGDWSPSSIK